MNDYKMLLVLEDGTKIPYDTRNGVQSLVREIIKHDVETIAVFEIAENNAITEKQFLVADVMPSGFGKE